MKINTAVKLTNMVPYMNVMEAKLGLTSLLFYI